MAHLLIFSRFIFQDCRWRTPINHWLSVEKFWIIQNSSIRTRGRGWVGNFEEESFESLRESDGEDGGDGGGERAAGGSGANRLIGEVEQSPY